MKPAVVFGMMGHRGILQVAEAIWKRSDVMFLTFEPSTQYLSEGGIPCIPLLDFLPKHVEENLFPEAIAALENVAGALQRQAFRDAFPFLSDDVFTAFRQEILGMLPREFLQNWLLVETLRAAAREFEIRIQIFSEDTLHGTRLMIATGRELGIPTLHVMHGVPCGPPACQEWGESDYCAAFSPHTRDQLLQLNVPPDRIHITGNPAWDALTRPPSPRYRQSTLRNMGLNPGEPVVTYAASRAGYWSRVMGRFQNHHAANAQAVLDAFTEVSRRHPSWQFLMRPRPGGDPTLPLLDMVDRAREKGLRNIQFDMQGPRTSVIISDVMLATNSNMSIEAILQGKPTLNINLPEFGAEMYQSGLGPLFGPEDAVLEPRSVGEIAEMIEAAILDEATRERLFQARERSIRRFNCPNDARAAERVGDLACTLGGLPGRVTPMDDGATIAAEEANIRGEGLFHRGDIPGAIASFAEAIRSDPKAARFHNNLAAALVSAGALDEAWYAMLEAIHWDAGLESARANLMDLAGVLGREKEARQLLRLFPCRNGAPAQAT